MSDTQNRPLYFDCDTGIDDSLALAYLLASPEVELAGIGTVCGNTDAEQAARNTLGLLALADRDDVPVAVGRHDFLTRAFDGGAKHVHGENGVGDVTLPEPSRAPVEGTAAEMLIRLSHEYAGTLEVVAVGPLSNLATALEIDPSLPSRVARVTLMGGAALVAGNISPVAEANIGNDPEAAAAVLGAAWPVIVAPLDVTLENVFEEEHRALLLASHSPVARAVGEMLDFYMDFYVATYGRRCSALHDPLAAALAVGQVVPTNAPAVPVTVDTTAGPGRGQLIADLRGQRVGPVDHADANVRIVLATDAPLAGILAERVANPPR
ncbi:nucleoside hydrolase [Microbacterium bovistercoris]|uniref:Nucleoside hydrolase n=1 Tax=Microbacterium bovistercoris TaxID=2293570 RepID=A0A371NZ70_9MICO|nr:nucleoside hydrolase [Microbacterium bovistercoris]REJ08564.1 nucleoside hydrolase [Microbacterium bovistercoris]